MKKMSRKQRKMFLLCGGCAAVLLLAAGIVYGVTRFTSSGADTEEGIAYIKAAEAEDITVIEQKIAQLESQDSGEEDTRSAKEKFASSVVMGDSITEGLVEYDVLSASSVVSKIGVHLDELDDQVAQVKELNPQVIFLTFGMNDIIEDGEDTEQFRSDYEALVKQIQEEVPDAHIFVNSIFPVLDTAVENEPALERISEYNTVLSEMCTKLQIGFIDNTELVSDQYYEEDGIHFKAECYPLWADRMAEVAAL